MKTLSRFDMAGLRNDAREMIRKGASSFLFHRSPVAADVKEGDYLVLSEDSDGWESRLYEKAPDGYDTPPSFYENIAQEDAAVDFDGCAAIQSVLVTR